MGVALPRSYVSEPTLRLCIPTCTSVVAVPVRSSLLDGYMFFGLPTDSRLVVVPKLQIHSTYVPSSEPSPASLIQSSKILHDLTPHTWGPSAYIVAPASPLLGCQQYCHCWDCRNSCTLSQMLQIVLDSLRQLVKKSPRQHRVYDTMCTSGQGAGCTHHQANQHNTSLLLLPLVEDTGGVRWAVQTESSTNEPARPTCRHRLTNQRMMALRFPNAHILLDYKQTGHATALQCRN